MDKEHYLVVDSADVFNWYRQECLAAKQIPAVNFNDVDELELVAQYLCDNLGYRPRIGEGISSFVKNIEMFASGSVTALQRDLLTEVAKEVAKQFLALRVYDREQINMYEFDAMIGGSIGMRKYGKAPHINRNTRTKWSTVNQTNQRFM